MNFIHDYFQTEREALAEIDAMGYYATVLESEATSNDEHWHDFHSVVYVLDGELEVVVSSTGEVHKCGPGTRIENTVNTLHSERTPGVRLAMGSPVPVEQLTQPIDKPPSLLP